MSYSSCGEAEGGSVATCDPLEAEGTASRTCGDDVVAICDLGTGVALADATAAGGVAIRGGVGSLPASVERSSGAPAARPPGAPTDVPLSSIRSGAAITVSLPSVRGAPGAVGCCVGSNTSERRPGGVADGTFPEPVGAACAGGAAPPRDPNC